jgi:hypothetical protein
MGGAAVRTGQRGLTFMGGRSRVNYTTLLLPHKVQ